MVESFEKGVYIYPYRLQEWRNCLVQIGEKEESLDTPKSSTDLGTKQAPVWSTQVEYRGAGSQRFYLEVSLSAC